MSKNNSSESVEITTQRKAIRALVDQMNLDSTSPGDWRALRAEVQKAQGALDAMLVASAPKQ